MRDVRFVVRSLIPERARPAVESAEADRNAAIEKINTYTSTVLGDDWTARGTFAFDGSIYVTGFVVEAGTTPRDGLPLGLRYDVKSKEVVPAKKTDEGKDFAHQIGALAFSYPYIEGLGGIVCGDKGDQSYFTGWSFHILGGDVFATLSVEVLDDRQQNRVIAEEGKWEPVRLSAFHAAREEAAA